MGKIPQSFVDDVLARNDIVDIIQSRINIKKSGINYMGLCPFHHEKSSSFCVSPTKQFYYCFGCAANGTAIRFLMQHDHLSFIDALTQLATKVGMSLPETSENPVDKEDSTLLYQTLGFAAKFYREYLKKSPIPQLYLKKRGISSEMQDKFLLGYAPAEWDQFTKLCLKKATDAQKKQKILQTLEKCGLWIQKEKSTDGYDRFRNRVLFPIRDRRGRVVAFGGRVLDDSLPKYLNSPETPVFHKSRELYGLYESLQSGKSQRFIVVEGYLDVISLVQHEIQGVVAPLGTALSLNHIKQMFQHASTLVFCFDGDEAGQKAAWRALLHSLPAMEGDKLIRFAFLPQGFDPDSYVRKEGRVGFLQVVEKSLSLTQYLLQELTKQSDLNTIEGRAKLINLCKPLIQQIPDKITTTAIINELASLTQMTLETIQSLMNNQKKSLPQSNDFINTVRKKSRDELPSFYQKAMSLLLLHPEWLLECKAFEVKNAEKDGILFDRLINFMKQNPNTHLGSILESFDTPEDKTLLAKLAMTAHILEEEEMQHREFLHNLKMIEKHHQEKILIQLQKKIEVTGLKSLSLEEKTELNALLQIK